MPFDYGAEPAIILWRELRFAAFGRERGIDVNVLDFLAHPPFPFRQRYRAVAELLGELLNGPRMALERRVDNAADAFGRQEPAARIAEASGRR